MNSGDILFRGLTIVSAIIIILIVFSQWLLPGLVGKQAEAMLNSRLQTETSKVSLATQPGILLLAGRIDNVEATAENAVLGQLRVSSLALEGENVEVDVRSLVAEQRLQVRSADELVLHATVKASDLAAVLAKKVDKLKDVEVDIKPAGVQIKGSIPLAGRTVEVNIEGAIMAKDGGLYFHMRQVQIRNAVLGQSLIAGLFDDILLTDLRTSPFQLEAAEVIQKNGEISIMLQR
ncbi:MAG: LmeA family phospholipid-binding protein [Selenomonadaceae bacterium]